jgi:DNA-binding beta-propeller fold protein YncE
VSSPALSLWLRRALLAAAALAVTSVTTLVVPPGAGAATWATPAFARSIGGAGQPGMFAWGTQYNPVSDELLVGDYLQLKIRRFDATTGAAKGEFYRPDNKGQPYSLAVNRTTGAIYVPEIGDSQPRRYVAVYDRNGVFQREFRLGSTTAQSADYYAWIATDNAGLLYVLDSHYWNTSGDLPRVMVYDPNDINSSGIARLVRSWSVPVPSGGGVPRMYGIDIDDQNGRVYASDAFNNRAYGWTLTGTKVLDFGGGIVGNDARGVTVDEARDRVYVTDGSGDRVNVFNRAGAHLGVIGGRGNGPGQMRAPRQTTVGPGGKLWVAEYSTMRFQAFDPVSWQSVAIFPDPARPASLGHFSQVLDVDVNDATGIIWTVDANTMRVQAFNPDGTLSDAWGHRGGDAYGFNYPRGLGVDPGSGNVWIANQRAHTMLVYDAAFNTPEIDTIGQATVDSANTNFLRWPEDIDFHNGVAVVSDTVSGKVKLFDAATRNELRSFNRANEGLAVDPATGRIYVLDPATDKVYVHDWNSGALLFSFGGTGTAAGKFQFPYDATVVGNVLYVTDNQTSFISAFDLNGTYLGRFGGVGAGPYQFRNPAGIDHDAAGRLYVADSSNMRVQIFNTNVARPAFEAPKPTLTMAGPGQGAVVPGEPVAVAGTAADNAGIARVEVAVRNDAGLWFDGRTSVWVAAQTWNQAPWWGSDTRSVAYDWRFVALDYGRSYHVEVRAADVSNNLSPVRTSDFAVLASSAADTADPEITLSAPTEGRVVIAGQAVPITGGAADDVGVTRTAYAVQDGATSQWLQPNGTWGAFGWVDTPPSPAGTPSVSFAASFTPPAPGAYGVTVFAWDFAGHQDPTRPFVQISAIAPDTTPPDGTVATPKAGQELLLASTLMLSGNATDDRGVARVDVAIKKSGSTQWLHADGTYGAFAWLPATAATPGATATGWTYDWAPSGPGGYVLQVQATDTAGNVDPVRPSITFSVVDPATPDTTPPDGTATTPTTNQALWNAPVITLAGNATDNRGVATVDVAVKNAATNQWLRPDGSYGTFGWVPAAVATPGATATGWTFAWTPPGTGNYVLQVRATDTAGNIDPSRPNVQFSVIVPPPDTVAPNGTLGSPTVDQAVPFAPVIDVTGNATDDRSVAAVHVAVKDNATGLWLRLDGTWAAFQWLPAALAAPGAPSSGWTYAFAPPGTGAYTVQVQATDDAGNTDAVLPAVSFSVV